MQNVGFLMTQLIYCLQFGLSPFEALFDGKNTFVLILLAITENFRVSKTSVTVFISAPEITEETTKTLEELILQRIKDKVSQTYLSGAYVAHLVAS